MLQYFLLVHAIPLALAGTILWDGRFNDVASTADLNKWSWTNQVGPYQYYIHGPSEIYSYVNLAPEHKNPADAASVQGVKISLTNTSYWSGQTMRRTELIPQTKSAGLISKGKLFYHFSISSAALNAPSPAKEHQIAFFESHFTELKFGSSSSAPSSLLEWFVAGSSRWSVPLVADKWHNIAYGIDFDVGSVEFWHSTGEQDLVLKAGPVTGVTTTSNGQDWHLGVLELPQDGVAVEEEDWFFSGVYVEDGELTKTVIGPASLVAATSSLKARRKRWQR